MDSISLDIESNFADNDSVCKTQRFVTLKEKNVTARNQSLYTLDSTSDVIESNIEDKSSTLDSNLVVFSSVCKYTYKTLKRKFPKM